MHKIMAIFMGMVMGMGKGMGMFMKKDMQKGCLTPASNPTHNHRKPSTGSRALGLRRGLILNLPWGRRCNRPMPALGRILP